MSILIRGGTVVTADEAKRADVYIEGGTIKAVGAKLDAPSGARVIDVSGTTIIPGWVDIHAHMWPTWDIHKTQVYEYLVNLAYGVTTTRDPQTSTTDVPIRLSPMRATKANPSFRLTCMQSPWPLRLVWPTRRMFRASA